MASNNNTTIFLSPNQKSEWPSKLATIVRATKQKKQKKTKYATND